MKWLSMGRASELKLCGCRSRSAGACAACHSALFKIERISFVIPVKAVNPVIAGPFLDSSSPFRYGWNDEFMSGYYQNCW